MLNWKQRIDRAKKEDRFTKKDYKLAGEFNTCALGEKLHLRTRFKYSMDIKGKFRMKYGTYSGTRMYDLGMKFYRFVKDDNIKQAEQIYNKIQKIKVNENSK